MESNRNHPTKRCKHCQSEIDVNAKICPICHKKQGGSVGKIVALVVLALLFVIVLASCLGGNKSDGQSDSGTSNAGGSSTTDQATNEQKTYGLGEVWTVDGQWSLSIDSVTTTEERNSFSDKTPGQVVVVTYSYENLGYTSEIQNLYISDMDMSVIDSAKAVGYSYPGNITTMPQETPVGARCNGAQFCEGLDNPSTEITINVEKYDSSMKKHTATFVVPVQ